MKFKALLHKSGPFLLLPLFLLLGATTELYAQVEEAQPDTTTADTLQNAETPEEIREQQRRQMQQQRPGAQPGGGGGAQQPEQEGQVNFSARDSLIFDMNNQRNATLYGQSKVTHTAGELTAGKITMDLDKHEVDASTTTPGDSLSQPVLQREQDRIRSDNIKFNYQSEKGRFEVARVQVEQGNLIGDKVKNTDRHTIFVEDGIYSTCTLDHPHYYIKADRMKVVDRDEVFFTRARLYILDIPYPLVFPFGYLPLRGIDQRQSGLLEPTYAFQETDSRGLGLQNLGWFQYFNEHLVGQAAVDIFTSGTFYLDASSTYRVTDRYNGSVQIGYSRENGALLPSDPGYSPSVQKRVSINHSQTISPYANFSTNINYRTTNFFKRNSYDPDDRARTSTSSSMNYRYRHPEDTYNFSISANQNQNFRTNTVQLSGPKMNFSLKQFSPFEDEQQTGDPSFLEGISIRYQNEFDSEYEFQPIRADSARINWLEALLDPAKYREATDNEEHYRFGFRQQMDFSFGNILPGNFVNLTPRFDYNEYWFPTSIRKSFNADSNRVETEKVRGFESARDFSTGMSMNTTFYGLWNQKIGNITAFRHTVRPTLSFTYRPDFSSDFWGFYREVRTDTASDRRQKYSIFEDEVFRGPGRGESRSLSFSLDNVFEAKQVKRDSLGEKNEKNIRLIDRLNFSSSYNFAADSLKLSDMNVNFSTSIVEGVNIRAGAQFNFYQRGPNGGKIDDYLWEKGEFPELLNWNVSASYSLQWGGRGRGIQTREPSYPAQYDPLNQRMYHGFNPRFNSQPVQPLTTPLDVSFNFSYRWTLNPNGENRESATLNANSIRFRLTPKWQFSTQIGYDFVEQKLTPSRFSLSRDLHCWNLSFEMNPFGDFQYFFFRLSVDSGQLAGIIQKLPGLNNLERSSSPTGRGRGGRYGF
ncbi:LPS-assembly protein LptD [Aliifodinibius sp. S!AR15-10]|uniref:putative LPS assembly protein LptD n=1 Tax=Aliifodinibius sp. S!AR15-10 TaxID=2950437 RepID=UPI0028627851|nr:putative LPS assembly protein LptD [Aliifodinibius sp. S!AR15-10]MDR8392692.1 LPS-assembly protein LptD [Aliifodinibius sp. S!AR15-10]